jgi:hypothetical protein
MLAAVIEGPGAVAVRIPPGVARALAASERPEHLKITRDVPSWPT